MRIVAAAIYDGKKVWTLPPPARHHTIIKLMHDNGAGGSHLDDQGFIDEWGKFYTREDAAELVLKTGQCRRLTAPPLLFSEDLW